MGSKKLKAIAVRGTSRPAISDEESTKKAITKIINALFEKSPRNSSRETSAIMRRGSEWTRNFSQNGSWDSGPSMLNERGMFPTRNFQTGVFPNVEKIDSNAEDVVVIKHTACYACPIRCSKVRAARKGIFAGYVTDGPEYETVWAFSAQCGNDDVNAIIAADYLVDNLGLDGISTGNVIGFAMELYQQGILRREETDGLDLGWGNTRSMIELVRKIAFRDGFGDVLAEGVARAAKSIGRGAEYYAMHSKGMELPAYDCRGA